MRLFPSPKFRIWQEPSVLKGNCWIFRIGLMGRCQRVPKFDSQSQFLSASKRQLALLQIVFYTFSQKFTLFPKIIHVANSTHRNTLLQIVFYTFSQKIYILPILPSDNNTLPFYKVILYTCVLHWKLCTAKRTFLTTNLDYDIIKVIVI